MLVKVYTKVRQQLLNFKITRLKASIFHRGGALDVKPVSPIWWILL
jgi:hypothetical protein